MSVNFQAFTYSLPFKKAFKTARRSYRNREGVLLLLEGAEGLALGEAAPLPDFSPESVSGVIEQLTQHGEPIRQLLGDEGLSVEMVEVFSRKHNLCPSLRFGLFTLALHHLSRLNESHPGEILFDRQPEPPSVNGVIAKNGERNMLDEAQALVTEGFSTLKLKVGSDFEQELSAIRKIRKQFPHLTLRIDANRAWDPDTAAANLSALEKFNIEFCEEPVQEATPRSLEKLGKDTGIPLALDESLLTAGTEILEALMKQLSVIIIKPMVYGALTRILATKEMADRYDTRVVFTTSLESGIGRHMTAVLAGGLGSAAAAHGLSTGSLLEIDVWRDAAYIQDGRYLLPDFQQIEKDFTLHRDNLNLKLIPC